MRIGVIKDEIFLQHRPAATHPENPQRLVAIYERLQAESLLDGVTTIPLREASDAELLAVHDHELLQTIQATAEQPFMQLDADTYTSDRSHHVARVAAGSCLNGVDALLQDQLDSFVALIRPPGHHAERSRAMGFCLFNNVAVAAAYALNQYNLERIAIVDWDLHHGNGTQQIFYQEPKVLYISSHEYPQYPGTGSPAELGDGAGRFYNLNFPLPSGLSEEEVLSLYSQVVVPTLRQFKPQLLCISAGFDAHEKDPLGRLSLSTAGFQKLAATLESLRIDIAELKSCYLLEGGYNLNALAASVAAVMQHLRADAASSVQQQPSKSSLSPFCKHLLRAFDVKVHAKWGWPEGS